jgi:hypothetical protein
MSTGKVKNTHERLSMMTLGQIQECLKDRRPGAVAEKTGLHVNTILRIRNGGIPSYAVAVALSEYLEERHKAEQAAAHE